MVSQRKRTVSLQASAQSSVVKPLMAALTQAEEATANHGKVLRACAARMRKLRKIERVSLRQVAKQMRRSAAYISDVELGRRNLSAEFAEAYIVAVTLLRKEKRTMIGEA